MKEFHNFIDKVNKTHEETNRRMSAMKKDFDSLCSESKILKDTIKELEGKVSALKSICNDHEQYSRRECLEIQGIPLPPKGSTIRENTNELVLKVGNVMGVQINKDDISVSQRLPMRQSYMGKRSVPAIIVKFVRRDTKELFYRAQKKLKDFTKRDLGFPDGNNIFISESLTEANKELFKAALKFRNEYSYDFIWTSNGKVYLQDDRYSQAKLIRSEDDLLKL